MDNRRIVISLAILLVVVLLGALFVSCNQANQMANAEKFFSEYDISDGVPPAPKPTSVADASKPTPDAASSGIGSYMGSDPKGNEVYNPVTGSAGTTGPVPAPTCYPRDRLTAEDLLPKDSANSKWAQMNPAGQGDVQDQNFLTAGYHIGVNTQGQSLRNANYQLRSEPANPQMPVSPWNIATIEPDVNRRPLEIGGDF
jgi:hypothetical protein